MAAASSIHINIFGPHPIVIYGTKKQKENWLPPLISGQEKTCFGVTEPDSGLDTGRLKTKAKKVQGGYIINGQKIWTSTAQIANKILLLARTTDLSKIKKSTDGLTLFYTNFDREKISNLFSNISTLNILELFNLRKDYENLGYSSDEIEIHLLKLSSTPLLYGILTVLSAVIMFNFKRDKSLFYHVILGILMSVIIYYMNFMFTSSE